MRVLLCVLLGVCLYAASPQTLEFTGYIVNPIEGPYNQNVLMRVQIINRQFDAATREVTEVIKWEKIYDNVYIHNGQFQIYLAEDDENRQISSVTADGGVFQSNVDYSFDGTQNKNLIDRAVYPDSSYAVRVFIKRTATEDWEQIKPDYNIDGSPFAISSIGLTGYDNKQGQLTITASSTDLTKGTSRAVIEVDTMDQNSLSASYERLRQEHGAYMENTTLKISMDAAVDNLAFDIKGSVYAENSEMTLGFGGIGDTVLEEGNIIFDSLCMSEDCAAANAKFNGELLAYRSVQFDKFEDSDDPIVTQGLFAGTRYILDPSGQTTFRSLGISNLSTIEFPFTLRLKQNSNLNVLGNAGVALTGDAVDLRFNLGGIKMDLNINSDGNLTNHLFKGGNYPLGLFAMQYDGTLDSSGRNQYIDPKFFKLSAGKLISPFSSSLLADNSEFYTQPSGLSKMNAVMFHFPDKDAAKSIINQRIQNYRFPDNFKDRQVTAVFDPVLTEDILNQLLSGDILNLHNHDLISQAKAEELINIINDPQYQDPAFITYPNIDPELAKLPVFNIWTKQTKFRAAPDILFQESSFLVKGELVASYGQNELKEENAIDRVQVAFGVSNEKDFAYVGSYNQFTQSVKFKNPSRLLDIYAGGLNVFGSVDVKAPVSPVGPAQMIIDGEMTAYDSLLVDADFYSNGFHILGCFPDLNHCPEVSVVKATSLSNATDIGASIFYDNQLPDFYFDPTEQSVINQLKLKGNIDVLDPNFTIGNSLNIGEDLQASNIYIGGTTGAFVEGPILLTGNDDYYSNPNDLSVWQNLYISGPLNMEEPIGRMVVIGETSIAGQISASAANVSLDSTIKQIINAPRFVDIDNPNLSLDPDQTSTFSDLDVETSVTLNGDSSIGGNLDQGSTMVIQGVLTLQDTLETTKFIDEDDPSFAIDPNGLSSLKTFDFAEMNTRLMTATSLSMTSGIMTVEGKVEFDGQLTIEGDTEVKGRLRQYTTTQTVFEVLNDGSISARSVDLTESMTVEQRADLGENLMVNGNLKMQSPSYFQELHLQVIDYLNLTDSLGSLKYSIDSAGNTTSLSGGLQATGDIRFLTASGRGLLASTQWMLATENESIRNLEFRRSDGLFLDLASQNLTSQITDASSKAFVISDFTKAKRLIDSDNSDYDIELNGIANFNKLSVKSTTPITVKTNPVRISSFNDLNDPRYKYDPSSLSHTKDLTVDQTAIFRQSLTIEPNADIPTNTYDTKLSFQKSLTSSNETLLEIDDSFAISGMGHLTSNLDYFQQGSMEIIDSVLILGETGSEVSIGKLTMTTLIILPATAYDPTYQSTFPIHFADHLHHHDLVADIDGKQFARKSEDNIFRGENRFVSSANAVTLSPSLISTASWIDTNTTNLNRYSPFILPRSRTDGGFYVGHGYSDVNLSTVNSSIVSFSEENLDFNAYADSGSGYLRAMHLTIHPDSEKVYLSGGLADVGRLPDTKLTTFNGSWTSNNLPKGIAYHQSVAFKTNLYTFGGVTSNSNGLTYPNTQSFIGEPSNIVSYSSNLPSQNILHNDSVLYIKGNSIYRNTLALDDEELVYQHSENIFAPQVSPTGLEICFHTATKKLLLYSLVTRAGPITIQDPGHHCQWGQNGEEDYIFFINSNSASGPLARDNRKGDDLKVFDGNDLSPNLTPIAIRDLHIADNGSVSAIGAATLEGFDGERIMLKKSDDSIEAVDSDGDNSTELLSSAINASHPQIYANQLYYVSSAASSNSTNNLFLADTDGSFKKQLSFIPQGVQNRPVLLDDGDALVAVDAFYNDSNKLIADFNTACSASYDNQVYLFGAGANSDDILTYDSDSDSFETLEEKLPFSAPFSCTSDNNSKVYFQQAKTFWYFDLQESRFWPLADIDNAESNAEGTIVYSSYSGVDNVYFLEEKAGLNADFHSYNVTSDAWSPELGPSAQYTNSKLAKSGTKIFALGNTNSSQIRYFNLDNDQWVTTSSTMPKANMHSLSLAQIANDTDILILGGSVGATAFTSVWRYNVAGDSFESLPDLKVVAPNGAAVSMGHQQVYLFGGGGTAKQLQIYPLNAPDSNDFSQIMRVNLQSGELSYETSAPYFVNAARSPASSDVVYFDQDNGLRHYNPADKTHSTVLAPATADAVTGIAVTKENDWVYFSNLESGSETIYRVKLDGSGLENLSSGALNGTTGTVSFVSEDHQRLYYTNNGEIFKTNIGTQMPAVKIGTYSAASQVAYHSSTSVSERREGLLFTANSTAFSSIKTQQFEYSETYQTSATVKGPLILEELHRNKSGNYIFSARRHFATTNLFYLENGSSEPEVLTVYSGSEQITEPFFNDTDDAIYFNLNNQSVKLSGSLTSLTNANARDYNFDAIFTPKAHRNRSFLYENAVYTLLGDQLYKSKTLSSTPAALSWTAHQTLPQINGSDWQITQYRNRIFFFDERSKTIYRYHPEDFSLESKGVIQTTIGSGSLAVTSDAYYYVGSGSVSKLALLTKPDQNLSVEVYSAADSNPDSTAIQIMSFDPSGRFFGRRLQGTADFDDQTVSGGPGDLGIEDRSLASADLKSNAIVTNTIKDFSIERRHFFGDISETKIADESLSSELFQTGIIYSSYIKDREIDTRHLSLSTFESSKLSDLGFTNADFADESIQNENLKTNTISGDKIKNDTIVAAAIKSLTLLNEDFADYNLGSKQFLDGSIAAVDIATETIIERHFIENSVTTEKILASAVTTDKIRDFTLTTEKFLDYTIETSDLATESISGGLMLSEALESRHFVDDTSGIATDHLSTSSITWEKIANNAIDRSKVALSTVTSNDIATKTITNRELATGSITSDKIIDNSLKNDLIASDAIKAEKLATDAISEEDIANSTIIDRHFFSGGKGAIQTITIDTSAVSFGNRVRPAMGVYEDLLYVLGGDVSGGFKINLASSSNQVVTSLDTFPSNSFKSVYASNNTTLYLLDQSILYGFDFNSESYYQITSLSFEGSADTSMTAFFSGGNFYVAGGSGTHAQKLHSHDLSTNGNWTTHTNLPISISLPAVASDSSSVYLFGNGKYLQSSTPSGSWNSVNLTTSYSFEGAAGYFYENNIYLLGGETDSKIHKFNPSSSALTELNTQEINIGPSSSNQLINYLHRAYIPSFSGANKDKLLIWHPSLDASIENRHINNNAVVASKIRTASLETINFAIDSIDSARIMDGQIDNIDIENNVLTDNSIADEIFESKHFINDAIISSKMAEDSVTSNLIADRSLKDSDFDTDAIDSDALANNSVDSDAIATYAITDTKIESAAITLSKVATGVITATHVKDSEINTEDIATRTITNGVIAPLNILSRHIKDNEVLSRHIQNNAISRSKIATSSLQDDVFAVDAFDQTTMVQDLAVQDKHVAPNNITNEKITTDLTKLLVQSKFTSESLTSADLATGAIREVHIDNLQITNELIQTSILEDRSFADNAILTDHLINGLLTSDQFAEKTLKTTDFANRSLISNQFAVSSINSIHIISLSLHSDDFESGSIGDVISLSSISSIKVKTNDLLAEDWDDNAVNSDAMSTDSVLGIKVKTNEIQSSKIGLNQITRIKLKANSFVTEDLADSSLDKDSILSFTLGGEHLEDNSLDVANRMDDSSIQGLFVLSGVLSESKIQNDSIDSDSIGDYQIVTSHIVNLSILSEDIANNAIDKMKLATKDVFNSDNIIDQSIRGESIVSFSLENAQLRDNAIRDDLIIDDVINAFSAENVAGVTFDASTATISGTFGHVQPIGDKFYTHQQGADQLQSTTDFSSMTTLGNSPCSGDSINAFYFYNAQEGFTACNNKQLYLTEDSAQNWKTITGLPEIPHLLHFFDRSNGYLMTKTGTQEELWESTDGGLNWTSKFGPNDNFHQWEIHRNTMVVVESDSSNQNTKFHYTKNAGSSWTSTTMTTDYHYGLAIDPETEDLWGIHRDGSDYKIVKYQSYGPNHDVKVSNAIITNLLNVCKPGDWSRIVNGIFYAFSTSSGCGPIYHKISSGETFEVTGSSIQVNQPSDTGVGYLAEPIYLGESKFLVRNASNDYLTWQINQYEHIKDASLTSDSLNAGAITTNYWQFRSIDNTKFASGSITTDLIENNSFTHGKYISKQINATVGFASAISLDGGQTIIAVNDGTNTDKIYKSTNGGISFSQHSFNASGEVLQTIHGRGQAIIIGTSSGDVIISTDQGVNFTKITSTPFDSDARVGFAFDTNNFLVIGKNSANELIPAKYNPDLGDFITMKNSSNQAIVIHDDPNTIYAWDMDFIDGNTGYLTIKKQANGNVVYKTNDSGYSWDPYLNASSNNSRIQVFEDGEFVLVNADTFYKYSGDSQSSILTFPAIVGNATAMHFVSTDIGFVAFDNGHVFATYNGGASFDHLADLQNSIQDIIPLTSNKLMLTGTGAKTYQLFSQFDHYPINEISESDLSTSIKLRSIQIEPASLTIDDLSDGSITEAALAEASLQGSKLADNSISQQKIKTRSLDKFLFALGSLTNEKFTTDGIHGDQFNQLIITTELIKDGTIGSAELSGSNLSSDSLTDDAITTDIVQDESLYGEILTDRAIVNSHLKDESFTEYEFATGTFSDQNLVENSIQREHLLTPNFDLQEDSILEHTLTKNSLQDGQINSRLIMNKSIFGFNILTGVVTQSKINGAIVTEGKWQDDSIISSLINNRVITSSKVKANQISGSHFISDTISRSKYDNTSIPTEKIKATSISNRELADDSVIAGKLSTISGYLLTSSKFDSVIVSAGNLIGTFSEAAFGDDVFTSTRIADRIVTNIKMKDNFLTNSHFMDLGILNEDFANNSIKADHLVTNNNYADKLANNSITHDQIASHSLTNASLQSGLILSKFNTEIIFAEQLGTINQNHLANDAIQANHIKKYSLKADNFADDSFTSDKFANDSIVGPNLADNLIELADMNTAQLTSQHFTDGSLLNEDFKGDITGSKISAGTLTGGEFLDEFLSGANIVNLSISGSKIDTATISSREIKNNQIITRHFANKTLVDETKFALNSIDVEDIDDLQITSGLLTDGSITRSKIKSASLSGNRIKSGEIIADDISNSAIIARIINNNIPQDRLVDNSIEKTKIDTANKIAADKFSPSNIHGDKVADLAITESKLLTNSIDGSKFATEIDGNRIAESQIKSSHLTGDAFTSDFLVDNSITESAIAANALTNIHFDQLVIDTDDLIDDSIALAKIANSAITSNSIIDGTIETADIQNGAITNADITSFTLTNTRFDISDIRTENVVDGSLKWSNLAANALINEHFENSVITTLMISDSTIDLAHLTSGVSGFEIKDGDLTAAKFSTQIPGSKFKTADISFASVTNTQISSVKYAKNIPKAKIASNAVSQVKFASFIFSKNTSSSENGELDWSRIVGSDQDEYAFGAASDAADFLIFGNTSSSSKAISTTKDAYVIKYDSSGNTLWESAYGGTGDDGFRAMVKSSSNYVFVGRSNSASGGQISSGTKGGFDLHLVSINSSGDKIWDKNYGGSGADVGFGIDTAISGGLIVAGYSSQLSTDSAFVATNNGAKDAWLIKTDGSGNFEWESNYGGSNDDEFKAVRKTLDGGYLAAGYTASALTNHNGNKDMYLVKTDSAGNLLWEKLIGGSSDEEFYQMIRTSDDGFLAVGYSTSSNGDIGENAGNKDAVIFKLDSEGETVWSTVIGGSDTDEANDAVELDDGSYAIGISSRSSASNDFTKSSIGATDYWIFRLSASGELVWRKNYGGTDHDDLQALAVNSNNQLILAGPSRSNLNGETNNGKRDFLSIVLKPDSLIIPASINSADFLDNTIPSSRVADRVVSAANISDGSLGATELSGNIVSNQKIANGALIAVKLNSTDSSKKLSDGNLEDGSITSNKIGDGSITKSMLLATEVSFKKVFDLGADDNQMHADGEHYHLRYGNEACPSGYSDVNNLGFCVKSSDITTTVSDALTVCQQGTDDVDARVCSFQEYTSACKEGSNLFTNNTNYIFSSYTSNSILAFTYDSDSSCNLHKNAQSYAFNSGTTIRVRCCITK